MPPQSTGMHNKISQLPFVMTLHKQKILLKSDEFRVKNIREEMEQGWYSKIKIKWLNTQTQPFNLFIQIKIYKASPYLAIFCTRWYKSI